MKELSREDIKTGRQLLLGSIITLAVLRAAITLFYYIGFDAEALSPSFAEARDIFVLVLPVIVLMGAGTFRGSKPIRYIFIGTLLITFLLEFQAIGLGFEKPILTILLLADWLVRAVVIYFVLFNNKVATFFLYQRAQNFGEWMAVKMEEKEEPVVQQPKTKRKKGSAALEEEPQAEVAQKMAPGEEVEEIRERPKKRKKSKANWEDELGIFED